MSETDVNSPAHDSVVKGLLKGVTVSRLACVSVWVYSHLMPWSSLSSLNVPVNTWTQKTWNVKTSSLCEPEP